MRKVKSIQERMAQIRAAQQSGAYTLCPRCGEATMKPELHTNALSRQYDIMICDLCGMDEAKMAFMAHPCRWPIGPAWTFQRGTISKRFPGHRHFVGLRMNSFRACWICTDYG